MPTKRAPAGLNDAGKRLWREYTTAFELDERETHALIEACHTADELAAMQELFTQLGGELLAEGSTGQPVESPLVGSIRRHRVLMLDLLDRIKVNGE